MSEQSYENGKSSEQQTGTSGTVRLGLGRGKAKVDGNNDEPPAPTLATPKWNTSGNFERNGSSGNNNTNSGESFGSRSANNGFSLRGSFNNSNIGGFGSRSDNNSYGNRGGSNNSNTGGFGSRSDSNSFSCYNCNQTGHKSRDCPEPRKENRTGGRRGGFSSGSVSRGGFSSGSGSWSGFSSDGNTRGGFSSSTSANNNRMGFSGGNDGRNVNVGPSSNDGSSSMSITVFNNKNQQNNNDTDGDQNKESFTMWRNNSNNTATHGNNSMEHYKRTVYTNSSIRSGGFRDTRNNDGDRSAFNNRDNRGSGSNDNCFNCNKPGHKSYQCPEERKPREGGAPRNHRSSDDTFDQSGGRHISKPSERYIPERPPTAEDDIFGQALSRGENFGKHHDAHVKCTPEGTVKPIDLYEEANLGRQVLSNIRRADFREPTAIQRYTIPCIRQQDDLMACAQTGSGKTAAFLLPIIANLLEYHEDELSQKHNPPAPLCLILSPTRELALQTEREARKFAYNTSVIPCSAIGGHDTFTVNNRLQEGCHILSATTGRLKDMAERGQLSLKKIKYLVLDEADRMLDTGFEPDIRKLAELGLPAKDDRFTFMFSATFPPDVQHLAKHFLRENYVFLAVGTIGGANEDITQTIEEVSQSQKKDRLFQLLTDKIQSDRCLIFVETKRSADYLGSLLSQKNLMSTTMHGDRSQKQRTEAVHDFTNGKCPILVATSVAARGLDFPLIGYVINYDLPDTSDFYIHRIGRTGRAGHCGKSISFFDPGRESDRKIAPELVTKLTEAGQEVPEFLKKYTDNNSSGFYNESGSERNTDMRSSQRGFVSRNQLSGPTGGTASAGQAQESWD